jgi:undecaprenyl-diphosphatase
MNIDLIIFNAINVLARKYEWLDTPVIFLAENSEYILAIFLVMILIYNLKKYWKMVLEAIIVAIVTRFVIAEIIRKIWFRPRPFVSHQVNQLINYNSLEASFPSGHACFYFAFSTIIYFYNKRLGIAFYIFSLLIVFSRVFVGIHWPSDILAGAVIGIIMGIILNKLFKKHGHKIIKNYNSKNI